MDDLHLFLPFTISIFSIPHAFPFRNTFLLKPRFPNFDGFIEDINIYI